MHSFVCLFAYVKRLICILVYCIHKQTKRMVNALTRPDAEQESYCSKDETYNQ